MLPEAKKLVLDALQAAEAVNQFIEGKTEADYLSDLFLRSAVERQLFVVGEAITQLRQVDRDLFNALAESRRLVGFRNLLAHGYGSVDDRRVWALIHEELPTTVEQLQHLMKGPD